MRNASRLVFCIAMSLALDACAQPAQSSAETQTPQAQASAAGGMRIETVAGGLEHPWAVALLPEGGYLVSERPGRLRLIEGNHMLDEPITGVPEVSVGGHSGLLDVLVDRDFPNTHRIFLSYMHGGPDGSTIRIVRARLDGMALEDKQVIFESRPAVKATDQIGGRLAFGPDGMLYLTIGDRFQMERAQNLLDDGGKIIRIRDDGSIPEDNPFVGREGARPEVYTYGHRNPQGLAVDARTGRVWEEEHGAMGGDEINLLRPGANYGWPNVAYGLNYDGSTIGEGVSTKPGIEPPVHYWDPSIAPSGMANSVFSVATRYFAGWEMPTPPPIVTPSMKATMGLE